jgi:hypothetical protein
MKEWIIGQDKMLIIGSFPRYNNKCLYLANYNKTKLELISEFTDDESAQEMANVIDQMVGNHPYEEPMCG